MFDHQKERDIDRNEKGVKKIREKSCDPAKPFWLGELFVCFGDLVLFVDGKDGAHITVLSGAWPRGCSIVPCIWLRFDVQYYTLFPEVDRSIFRRYAVCVCSRFR